MRMTHNQIKKAMVVKQPRSAYAALKNACKGHIQKWGNESARRVVRGFLPEGEARIGIEHIPQALRQQAAARLASGPYRPVQHFTPDTPSFSTFNTPA
jgi:hypothetical protein